MYFVVLSCVKLFEVKVKYVFVTEGHSLTHVNSRERRNKGVRFLTSPSNLHLLSLYDYFAAHSKLCNGIVKLFKKLVNIF